MSSLPVIDPRTGETTGQIETTPVETIRERQARAREAQTAWMDLPLADRKTAVAALHQGFLAQADAIAEALLEDCGRPAGEAWTAEIVANHELFGWWLGHIDDLFTATPVDLNPINYPGKTGRVRLAPKGVVGLITPWNLPVAIPLRTIIPAVLAGNAVVWKPSEHAPRTAELLAKLFAAHLPEGLIQPVIGAADQGAAVVTAGVDIVFFTGSVATGRKVQVMAAEQGIPCTLELGGKDAAVVLADADINRAADGITWAAYAFAGQNCAAVERCYVHNSVLSAFIEAAKTRTKRLRQGEDVGPLVTEAQLRTVQRHVEDAMQRGATVVCGADAGGPGFYYAPTLLTHVPEDALVLNEETFGPVLPVVGFDALEDLPDLVNRTAYGLTTSIWTSDVELGEALSEQFDCGVVTINNHSFSGALASAAWGGTKDTGHGVTNSRFALYEMTRPRTIIADRSRQREMWWYPYNDALLKVTQGLVEVSRSGGNRLPALGQVVAGLVRRWKE